MNIDKTMESPDIQPEKIKVSSIYVIASEHCNKPYYEIRYKEVGNDFYNIGYSSFNLEQVLYWRHRCFEVVPADEYERRDAKDTNVLGKWIPCSERLPKDGENVLCYVTSAMRVGDDIVTGLQHDGLWFMQSGVGMQSFDRACTVTAWMPLPEPYREVRQMEKKEYEQIEETANRLQKMADERQAKAIRDANQYRDGYVQGVEDLLKSIRRGEW